MEPRLDPTMIWSSERVKVSEVSAEGLLLLLPVVRTEMGLGASTLYKMRLFSSSPTAKLFLRHCAKRPQSTFLPIVW